MEDRLLTEREACTFLGVSRSHLARRRMEGASPAFVKFECAVRYRVSDLEQYVNKNHRVPLPK
jgi:predicted DNA-binding transcriptional regulator AlpA